MSLKTAVDYGHNYGFAAMPWLLSSKQYGGALWRVKSTRLMRRRVLACRRSRENASVASVTFYCRLPAIFTSADGASSRRKPAG